jgi:membrane associated rhomboid family serine protease
MSVLPVARVPGVTSRPAGVLAKRTPGSLIPARAIPGARARPSHRDARRRVSCFASSSRIRASPPAVSPAAPPHAARALPLPRARRGSLARAGKPGGAFGGLPDGTDDLLKKYGDTARATGQFIGRASGLGDKGPPGRRGGRGGNSSSAGNGVFLLLLVNVTLFVLDQVMHVSVVKDLYLNHMRPRWWQFFTSIFCHANYAHLSGNIFFLYVFGNIVEQEEGAFGVWFSYLFTGVGAAAASYLMLPKGVGGVLGMGAAATVSLGASGAVFGLFAISVLTKLAKLDFRKLLEAVILGQFVIERFVSEAKAAAAAGGIGAGGVNHVAHLAGALVGVALIWTLARILPPE